jgi:hypothetical protein
MEASSSPVPVLSAPRSPTGNGTAAAERSGTVASPAISRTDAAFERVELPPERRLSASTLAGLAAASGVAAIVLGAWAFYSGVRSDSGGAGASAAPPAHQQAISLLARGDVERLPLRGSVGRIILVVEPSGDATLVLNGLSAADSRWAYQAWVFPPGVFPPGVFPPGATPPNGGTARPGALFSGREALVPLTARVPPGATVAVTLEPAAGSFAPTRTPTLVVQRPL